MERKIVLKKLLLIELCCLFGANYTKISEMVFKENTNNIKINYIVPRINACDVNWNND